MPVRRQKQKRRDRVALDLREEHSARVSPPIVPIREQEKPISPPRRRIEGLSK